MNIPDDLRYAKSHEWLRADGTVGVTDHAQHELTDVVFVDLPQVGMNVTAGAQVCVVESVKAASDIYAPVAGTVTAINTGLQGNPALINSDPYGEGWIFRMDLADATQAATLMDAAAYRALLSK
jgi:glycine cleavage system H protein